MTKEAGLGDRLFVNGFDLSGDIGAIQNIDTTVGEFNATGIDKGAMERLQLLADGEISFNNFFTGDTSDVNNEHAHERLKNLSSMALVTYLRGTALGGACAGLVCRQFQYQLNRAGDGGLLGTVNGKVSGGIAPEWGRILDAEGFSDLDSGESQATELDLGAAHGIDDMAFYLHVTEFTGTDATLLIQMDTADTFGSPTTYGTFAQITAAHASERLAVSGAPERYIRWSSSGDYTSVAFVIIAVPLYD